MKTIPFPPLATPPSFSEPLLLFEDAHLIVLSKPCGLLSQGEKTGDLNLVSLLQHYLGRPYVGLIHRLDRNTSGVMIAAKRTKSAQRLTQALQNGQVERSYLAWVAGNLFHKARWVHFLKKNESQNQVFVCQTHENGKEAILEATPLQYSQWKSHPITLVEFRLETGRSHQIRVQSAHSGFPLLGDTKYGVKHPTAFFKRLALHSHRLTFPHPMSGETLSFQAPLPPEFKELSLK